jgi:hypothetical protein
MTKQNISTINVHHTEPPKVSRLTTGDDAEFFIIHVGAVALFFDTDAELQLWVSTLVTRMHTVLAEPDPT